MAAIYSNSTVTLAATEASNSEEGLFRKTPEAHISQSLSSSCHIYARKPVDHRISQSPLLKRGWVFQERLLSPRILHFAENELIWECMQHQRCECGFLDWRHQCQPAVWELDLAPKNHYHPAGWRLLRGKLLGGDNPWTIAAFEFACLKLSKPNDIFPAISGIAKSFEEATGWTYVAGIWRETMPLGLLWRTFKKGHRPVRWRAPSFSWASITFDDLGVGRGIYHIGLQSPKVSAFIKEAKVSPISKDPTGQLKGGYIVLSGTLIQAIISHVGVDDRDWHQAFLTPLGREREDSYRFGTDFDLTQSGHVVEDGEAVFCLEIAQGEVESKEMIWYMVLVKRNLRPWKFNGHRYDGEFERIGLFTEIIPQDRVNRKPFEEASPEYAVERNAVVKVI